MSEYDNHGCLKVDDLKPQPALMGVGTHHHPPKEHGAALTHNIVAKAVRALRDSRTQMDTCMRHNVVAHWGSLRHPKVKRHQNKKTDL